MPLYHIVIDITEDWMTPANVKDLLELAEGIEIIDSYWEEV